MHFKDIVNRDHVDLSNCESEPIHIPGSIQPHGFLLGIQGEEKTIHYCSKNIKDYTGFSHEQVLGKSLTILFSAPESQKLDSYLNSSSKDDIKPHAAEIEGKRYNITANQSNDTCILEFEPFPDDHLSLPDLYQQTSRFVSLLEKSAGLQRLCQAIAEETREIIGYDRVMVYRFDKDYNGEVFAESTRDDLEPFLGLNYPHTDIPLQARALYMKNLLRLISDVDYVPVPIYKLDDDTSDILDLGMCTLRSVSPMHTQYLNNMGVGATLTISLIHDQKLWGLIACHHYSPRVIPLHTRLAAQLQGNFLTSQIRVREVEEEHNLSVEIQKSLEDALLKTVSLTQDNFHTLADQSLLKLANSSGAVIMVNRKLYTSGLVPSDDKIRELAHWLSYFCPSGTYHTSRLTDDYEDAAKLNSTAAGIIYHSLGKSSENCVIWFRPEVIQTVNWAGDPNKSIEKNTDGLSPRKSFELWKEIRKSNSINWRDAELLAASNFAYALQKQAHLLHLTNEESRYKKLTEKLLKTNSELENMNWISTHDLKEPLRKIQIFASMILDDEANGLSETISKSISRMSQSANRMQTLLNDIMSYSQLSNKEEAFTEINLNSVLEELKLELKDEISESNAVITYSDLPVIRGIKFQIDQLLINLLRNSLKFAREGIAPEINISSKEISGLSIPGNEWIDTKFRMITLQDNGIGFSSEFNISLFEVFKRLHNYNKYKGNGIGLAISRKIMENHDGYIVAEGKENEGAVFYLYFPV